MPGATPVDTALERIKAGGHTQADLALLAKAVASGQRSVAIGGNAEGNVIVTGDGNTVTVQGPSADAIRTIVDELQSRPILDPRERRDRGRMLQRVRRTWIDGYLDDALHGGALLALGLEERPEAVPDRWGAVVQELDHSAEMLAPGTSIQDVFEKLDGELLILGEPGSGKTMTMLALVRGLLDAAEKDESLPIPVVFPLAPWAKKRLPLAGWLIDELNQRYDVPRPLGQKWVRDTRILPLLDGLDEVAEEHRAACVGAINAFRDDQSNSLLSLVVTCRLVDYDALPTQLRLRGAVVVQPLRPAQIEAYLESAGQGLVGVYAALQADATLRELASSPLLLSTMALTYRSGGAESLPTSGSIVERRAQMFGTYVDEMFARRSAATRYTKEQSRHWLRWLANALTRESQTVLYVERLQPEWLVTRSGKIMYVVVDRLVLGLLLGGLEGLIAGTILHPAWALGFASVVAIAVCLAGRRTEGNRSAWRVVSAFLLGGLATGGLTTLVVGLVTGLNPETLLNGALLGAVVGAPITGLAGGPWVGPRRIHLVERVAWSLQRALRSAAGSLSVVVFLALILVLSALSALGQSQDAIKIGLLVAIALGAPPALVTAVLGGFESKDLADETRRLIPNQGVHHGAHTALVAAGLSALASSASIVLTFGIFGQALNPDISTILAGPIGGLVEGSPHYVQVTLVLGLIFGSLYGLIGGLAYGGFAYLSHFVLRLMLRREQAMPLDYVRFLNFASDCIFLRKVGGGYVFVHRLLQEYFCAA
jgi:eukaryotic-like serine/threonine-protein kinase